MTNTLLNQALQHVHESSALYFGVSKTLALEEKFAASNETSSTLLATNCSFRENVQLTVIAPATEAHAMGLEIEAPTPDKHEKGAGRLERGTA